MMLGGRRPLSLNRISELTNNKAITSWDLISNQSRHSNEWGMPGIRVKKTSISHSKESWNWIHSKAVSLLLSLKPLRFGIRSKTTTSDPSPWHRGQCRLAELCWFLPHANTNRSKTLTFCPKPMAPGLRTFRVLYSFLPLLTVQEGWLVIW